MARVSIRTLSCSHLLAASLLLPSTAFSQLLSDAAALPTTIREQQYLDLIEARQDEDGLTAPELVEPLTALGLLYNEHQDYDRAFDALARARQILRVNQGFDSLQELPLLAELVSTAEARGDFAEAWELERSLLALALQHAGKLETVTVFREAAEKRLDIRRRYIDGERPPQIELGCYYGRARYISALVSSGGLFNDTPETRANCAAGERDAVNVALLLDARSYQMLVVEALLQNGRYASDELWQALTDMLQTSDLLQRRVSLFTDPALGRTMNRLLSFQPRDSAEAVRRAQILVLLADINVVRSRQADRYVGYDAALEQYRQAYELLRNENLGQAALDELFAPALPVVLPSYRDNPLAAVTETAAAGYIDLSFEINNRGRSGRVELIDSSESVTRSDRRKLEQLLYRSTFRPRVLDAQVADSARVTLRYYVSAPAD